MRHTMPVPNPLPTLDALPSDNLRQLKAKVTILTRMVELIQEEIQFKNERIKEYKRLIKQARAIPSLN